jgi:hypothetical protein
MLLMMVMVPMSFADSDISEVEKETRILKANKRNVKLFTNYNPSNLEGYLELYDEHESIHESIKVVKEELKELREEENGYTREESKSFREELKAKVESGEIIKEEVSPLIEEFTGMSREEAKLARGENSLEKEELDSINEKLKENIESRKVVKKNIFESLLENNDSLVEANLIELLSLQNEHKEYDEQKLQLLEEILNNYNN